MGVSGMSHLLQMRGLKHVRHAGIVRDRMSHLLQMRGLKQLDPNGTLKVDASHLLQMRGLKQNHDQMNLSIIDVASFTDAWIETRRNRPPSEPRKSHLLQMRGLKPRTY